ncbi:hypothetical protein [Planctomycetes bacterium CA13]|uniref:hypothetical protein n=1 Tax=Novipirellula herctigrandis TaxID=2527986 RepID=UPI0011B4CBB6
MNVDWLKGNATIRWDDTEITLPACVDSVLVCSAEPRVLALYGESTPTLRLAAYNSSGKLVVDLSAPPNRHFYYLSHHINHEHAVVCVSTGNELDWFFAVDTASQSLVSLNRAY